MSFIMVGIDHTKLNIDERKDFYFRESDKFLFSMQLKDEMINQIFILSTCNRSEVYVIGNDFFDENRLKELFLSYFQQKNDYVYTYNEISAFNHLLEVACGLQSMVIGEDQILHQIKESFSWTLEQNFSGKQMNYILQTTISFAKEMRKKYSINDHALSVSYIGYQKIKTYLKEDSQIMICGIGEMSQIMLEYLKNYPILLVNRTYENVLPYLSDQVTFIPFEKRYDYINEVDIVISATSSPHIVFDKSKMSFNHSIIFLDLAVPRDIDIQLKNNQQVQLIDMDDLKIISKKHLKQRKEISTKIKEHCYNQACKIQQDLQILKSDDIISSMQKYYLNVSNETYTLLKKKLTLSPKEDKILQKVLNASFLRLMKNPIRLLKSQDQQIQEKYIKLIEEILNMEDHQ